jgi:hypothetical protein
MGCSILSVLLSVLLSVFFMVLICYFSTLYFFFSVFSVVNPYLFLGFRAFVFSYFRGRIFLFSICLVFLCPKQKNTLQIFNTVVYFLNLIRNLNMETINATKGYIFLFANLGQNKLSVLLSVFSIVLICYFLLSLFFFPLRSLRLCGEYFFCL